MWMLKNVFVESNGFTSEMFRQAYQTYVPTEPAFNNVLNVFPWS
jgi:hypothetical protein